MAINKKQIGLLTCLGIILSLFFFMGCLYRTSEIPHTTAFPLKSGKIVVFGFKPAVSEGEQPRVVRSPFTGTVFYGEPVSNEIADKMTSEIFTRLLGNKDLDLVDPGEVKGVYASILSSSQDINDKEMLRKIGTAFSADALLIGHIYRWQDRVGGDYSVNRPASVAFDLYLLRPEDSFILWKGKYDKTQRSLSENILDMGLFLKGKGRWLTAGDLALLGLDEMLGSPKP